MLRQLVVDFSTREHLRRGYKLLRTPHLIKADIWDTSGHRQQGYPMYFTEIDGQEYGIKPMNCPGHILIYKLQDAQLPRPAAAVLRAGHGLPARAGRRAARAAARARLHAGRRAHLLHARAA